MTAESCTVARWPKRSRLLRWPQNYCLKPKRNEPLRVRGSPGRRSMWPRRTRNGVWRKAGNDWPPRAPPCTSPTRRPWPLLPALRGPTSVVFPSSGVHCVYSHIKQLSTSAGEGGVKAEGRELEFAFNRMLTEIGVKELLSR